MNKIYQKPAIDIEKFDVEDIITASGAPVTEPPESEDLGVDVVTVVDFN